MTYVATILADSPVGFYQLAESSGTTAADSSTNENNGTYTASGISYGQPGIPGASGVTCVEIGSGGAGGSFDVNVPDLTAQRVTDTLSYELWIKLGAAAGATYDLIGGETSGSGLVSILSGGAIEFGKRNVANIVMSTTAISDTTTWHHIVITKSGSTVHLYIDGADVSGTVTNATLSTNTGGTRIANNVHTAPSAYFAMAAWYTAALTSTQVTTHYTAGITAPDTSGVLILLRGG